MAARRAPGGSASVSVQFRERVASGRRSDRNLVRFPETYFPTTSFRLRKMVPAPLVGKSCRFSGCILRYMKDLERAITTAIRAAPSRGATQPSLEKTGHDLLHLFRDAGIGIVLALFTWHCHLHARVRRAKIAGSRSSDCIFDRKSL
jgi:hypothetical protein